MHRACVFLLHIRASYVDCILEWNTKKYYEHPWKLTPSILRWTCTIILSLNMSRCFLMENTNFLKLRLKLEKLLISKIFKIFGHRHQFLLYNALNYCGWYKLMMSKFKIIVAHFSLQLQFLSMYRSAFIHLNIERKGISSVEYQVINVRLYASLSYVEAEKQQQHEYPCSNTLFSYIWYDILLMVFLKCSQT